MNTFHVHPAYESASVWVIYQGTVLVYVPRTVFVMFYDLLWSNFFTVDLDMACKQEWVGSVL